MNPPGMKWNSSPDLADLDGYYIITLQAETRLRARNTGPAGWSNSQRLVVKASNVFAYEWSHIAEYWVFVEQVDLMNPTSINIAGYNCDCNAIVNIPGVSAGSTVEITPTVSGRNNYTYTMSAERPKVVGLGRAYHPNFSTAPSLASLQSQFDTVSDFLRQDSDGCISEFDFRVQPGSATFDPVLYRGDDVPVYVNFHVANNPPGALTFRPLNGIDFTHNVYYDLDDTWRIIELVQSNMAEVMQVRSIVGGAVLGGDCSGQRPGCFISGGGCQSSRARVGTCARTNPPGRWCKPVGKS